MTLTNNKLFSLSEGLREVREFCFEEKAGDVERYMPNIMAYLIKNYLRATVIHTYSNHNFIFVLLMSIGRPTY